MLLSIAQVREVLLPQVGPLQRGDDLQLGLLPARHLPLQHQAERFQSSWLETTKRFIRNHKQKQLNHQKGPMEATAINGLN